MAGVGLRIGANLSGAVPFPENNLPSRDISTEAVDPNSENLTAAIGLNTSRRLNGMGNSLSRRVRRPVHRNGFERFSGDFGRCAVAWRKLRRERFDAVL